MDAGRRLIACALVVVALSAPCSVAFAQQPPPPSGVVVEVVTPEAEAPVVRGRDIYDVGAGVVTVARAPFNVALCALGGATATALFLLTLGTAYRESTRAIEEGCAQRWIVTGDDLRPRGAPGVFPQRTVDPRNRW